MGVELEEHIGKNDGTVNGKAYFKCKPQHGLFVRPTAVTKREDPQRAPKNKRETQHQPIVHGLTEVFNEEIQKQGSELEERIWGRLERKIDGIIQDATAKAFENLLESVGLNLEQFKNACGRCSLRSSKEIAEQKDRVPRAYSRRRVATASVGTAAGCDATAITPRLPELRTGGVQSAAWQSYTPNSRTIMVIGPGGGLRQNAGMYDDLTDAGYDVVPVHQLEYDTAPHGSNQSYLYPPGWEDGTPDLSYNEGKNLATFADDVMLPAISALVSQGRGPAVIIAGSRGGQVTVPRLWACGWRGPTLVINGGCVATCVIPDDPVRLLLLTFGKDFFSTKDPASTARDLRKVTPHTPVFLFHNPAEPHMPRQLGNGVFQRLLKFMMSGEVSTTAFEGTLPQGTTLSVL